MGHFQTMAVWRSARALLLIDFFFINCTFEKKKKKKKRKRIPVWTTFISLTPKHSITSFTGEAFLKRGIIGGKCGAPADAAAPRRVAPVEELMLDPSGQAEHKRALPEHLAAPSAPDTEPDTSLPSDLCW